MGIQAFPTALQPIIQQNFLAREFEDGLRSILSYRGAAQRENFPIKIGETLTKTRPGLKAPVTTAMTPANNTNLDNGLTASTWTVEQFTLTINQYADTIDLNILTAGVGIGNQFLQNAKVNGIQSAQSLDRLARIALFNSYLGGNTRVLTTLSAAGTTIAVDDIRGFQYVFSNGVLTAVSATYPMSVTVNGTTYSLTAATADATNVSGAPSGISGTLTFSSNVTVTNGTAGNAVVSAVGPKIMRPNSRATTAALASGDTLSMSLCLDAVAELRDNAIPTINGLYNCYLDNKAARELFADDDFKSLYSGQSASEEFRMGRVIELLDLRFIPTTEAPQQTLSTLKIRRPIICGAGALIEGDFDGLEVLARQQGSIVDIIDGIAQITREPLDRLQQIIAQSWSWVGGFCCPTDQTVNTNVVPTANDSYYKRAIVLEVV